ncbi:MAG: 30S ribosomal protein S7 [Actinobacteria bacterium]|nr:30S ribosomal protein S7 [Actinomycetota bacterium]
MSRRSRPERRAAAPDPKYNNRTVQRFVNKLMRDGKKAIAQRVTYAAFDLIEGKVGASPIETFETAIRNVMPQLEVKPRRVGGATYQVPVEIRGDRRYSLAVRWILETARRRPGHSIEERLAAELMDAANGQGGAVRRREEMHRMAEANRAFSIYGW